VPELLIESLMFYQTRVKQLIAYTIMPDHIHAMVEVDEARSLSVFLRDFKKYTSRAIKNRIEERGLLALGKTNRFKLSERVWQPGTMDHCIRNSSRNRDFENHLSYLFSNSWKHLSIAPRDFPYHNFADFEETRVFDRDFFAFDEKQLRSAKLYE
jgi:REP element-mobilizing transposase RayT